MIGGRVGYDNDDEKDIFLLYYGIFHGSNSTIAITNYYMFNQGTDSATILTAGDELDSYSESGVLAILDDPLTTNHAITLTKFTEKVSSNQHYEVNLMSFFRNFTAINWMIRYRDNYQAEACIFDSKIYLMVTKEDELFFHVINPADGTMLNQVNYTIGNNEKLYFPQMAISNTFEKLFLIYKVDNTTSTAPAQDNLMRVSIFETSDLSLDPSSFTYTEESTPYSIGVLQKSGSERVVIKGRIDTNTNEEDNRFTFSFYPILHTQDFGSCTTPDTMTLTPLATGPTYYADISLIGLLIDIDSNKRLNTSDITYVASPGSLTPTSICTILEFGSKELIGTETTFRTINFTEVSVPKTEVSSSLPITYEIITPDKYDCNITEVGDMINFNFSGEYDLNSTFELKYYAKVNSSFYTTNTYTVTVECREECTYCNSTEACLICNEDNLGF